MKRKGFTLIELLAVIVVLAIIALIATPIVMNVIKKANAGAAERSADNYVKAVETLIATEKLDGKTIEDGNYAIDAEGNLTFGDVEVSGTKPVGGTIKIENGQVVKADTTINYEDYVVKFDNGVAKAEEKEAGGTTGLMTLADCDFVSGTEGEVGAKYTCNFGDKDRTFYILETENHKASTSTLKTNEVTLILAVNFEGSSPAWCASGIDNACAADGLEAKLDDIVESIWTKLDRSQIGIPSMEQIMVADGREEEAYLNGPNLTNEWLYGGLEGGPYWTSTPIAHGSTMAWFVNYNGEVWYGFVDEVERRGTRPIITLSI